MDAESVIDGLEEGSAPLPHTSDMRIEALSRDAACPREEIKALPPQPQGSHSSGHDERGATASGSGCHLLRRKADPS
jgi:hypothetical protein